jgi:DNA polymerase-3 subunit delta
MASKRPSSKDPLEHLESEGPRPVYAIDGDERLLVDEALLAIKKKTLSARAADFNFDLFTAPETPVSRILDAAKTLPAFAPLRMVVVKSADKLPAADTEALVEYVEDPSPSTVLVLVGDKFDARTKLYKAFDKAGATLRFSHASEREMPELIRRRAKTIGAAIDDAGIRMLIEAVGPDLGAAASALEKLVLYVGPGTSKSITAADVEALVSPAREESIFAFSDAVGRGDVREALRGLHNMVTVARGHPLGLLAMIARHWRKLLIAKSMLDAKEPATRIQSALEVPPFIVDKLIAQAKRHSVRGLTRGLRAIALADQAMKGGKLEAERVMERLVLLLARSGGARSGAHSSTHPASW